jgi:hypothetical protein
MAEKSRRKKSRRIPHTMIGLPSAIRRGDEGPRSSSHETIETLSSVGA